MFVDKATIQVKGGDGGNGCCSFRREKYVPKGGPDGGDGGNGGNVVIKTDPGVQSLVDFVYNRHFSGDSGTHGKGKNLHGKRGGDRVIKVPLGTIVTDRNFPDTVFADMDSEDSECVVARGGKGGKGNPRFFSNSNRVPREFGEGEPGEERELQLELKTIADAGLVGYPNAGKSTLLRAMSKAKPKVAPYPFTTLNPVVGMAEFPDFTRISIADIPGLIDGAHDDVGLGCQFLRHIERTKMLVYVLDAAGVDGRDPIEDFESLRRELELYMKGLSERPCMVVLNKTDLPQAAAEVENLKEQLSGYDVISVSALRKDNVQDLLERLRMRCRQLF